MTPGSGSIKVGDSITFTITPNPGMAVDTITIDSTSYMNNGKSQPPEDSSWSTVYIKEVTGDMKFSVTFSDDSDDDGIPDKYEHVVTASAGIGGTVSPITQYVVDGGDADISIAPDNGMAVDTITTKDDEYVNDGKE